MFVFVCTVFQRARALQGDQTAIGWTPALQHPPAAQHPQKLSSHVLTAQRVDHWVECWVQSGEAEKDFGLVQDGADLYTAGGIQEEDGKSRQPAHDEDSQHYCDRFQKGVCLHVGCYLVAGAHNQVDSHVENENGEQYEAENSDNKDNVLLGVEWQHSRAISKVKNTVPAEDGKSPEQDGGDPACSYQQKHAAWFVGAVYFDLCDSNIALYSYGQQAEDWSSQSYERCAFPDEPLHWAQWIGPWPWQDYIDYVGTARQQVGECQVSNEEKHGRVKFLVAPHSHQNQEILEDDDGADDQDDNTEKVGVILFWFPFMYFSFAHVLGMSIV